MLRKFKLPLLLVGILSTSFVAFINFNTPSGSGTIPANGTAFRVLAKTDSAGTIAGEFVVNGNGGATYKVDLEVPPGTNGVYPTLALTYNSQGRNGILGEGWLLDGISSIQRVGTTIATDGRKSAVRLDRSDRFAIDGQRLIAYRANGKVLVTQAERDAAYGQDGTEYRTEIESWTRFYSHYDNGSPCGDGPCYFTSVSKDGTVTEYGLTQDSRLEAAGRTNGVVRGWMSNKASDRNQNFVVVRYTEASDHTWYHPDSILYTGNTTSGLRPQRAVTFEYEARTDNIPQYVAGSQVQMPYRLKAIRTFVDRDADGTHVGAQTNLVNTYRIAYVNSPMTEQSLVSSITLFDPSGNGIPATLFSYDRDHLPSPLAQQLNFQSTSPLGARDAAMLQGDYDGNGFTDFIRQDVISQSRNIVTYLSDGKGGFSQITYTGTANLDFKNAALNVGDFNGDGRTDFLRQDKLVYSKSIEIYYSKGNGTYTPKTVSNTQVNWDAKSAVLSCSDFNGDGITDFMVQDKITIGVKSVRIYLMRTDGSYVEQTITSTVPIGARDAVLLPSDFNGDGITDLLRQEKVSANNYSVQVILLKEDGTYTISTLTTGSGVSTKDANILLGDFNGDHMTDFLRQESTVVGVKTIDIYFSRGDGSFTTQTYSAPSALSYSDAILITGDFNGDGLTDFLRQEKSTTSTKADLYILKWNGNFDVYPLNASVSIDARNAHLVPGDYNGDQTTDFIRQDAIILNQKSAHVFLVNIIGPTLMTGIQNGIGEITRITYASLTDPAVYTKGNKAIYPLIDYSAPLWLVSKHQTTDAATPPTFDYAYNYQYAQALIDATRGWLGFNRTILDDLQHDMRTTTSFHQQFPFTGRALMRRMVDLQDTTEVLGIVRISFKDYAYPNKVMYSVFESSYRMDHYTEGTYNYTLVKNYTYSPDGGVMLVLANHSDLKHPEDDLYTGFAYGRYDETGADWWKAFFPVQKKITTDSAASIAFQQWDPGKDLAWEKYTYDSRFNIDSTLQFRDTDGGLPAIRNTWITTTELHDTYGNAIQTVYPGGATWKTTFDPVYHTFPIRVTSPKPRAGGVPIEMESAYDPRFGVEIAERDPNGNFLSYIPDQGLDGIGRIVLLQETHAWKDSLVTVNTSQLERATGAGYVQKQQTLRQYGGGSNDWLTETAYYDAYDREVRFETNGYNPSTALIKQYSYDDRGYVSKDFMPYFYSTARGIHYSEDGPSVDSAAYIRQIFDRHGRLFQMLAPDPGNLKTHYLARQVDYELHDDRTISYRVPHPDDNAKFVRWVQTKNAIGKTLTKSGPFADDMSVLPETTTSTYAYDPLGRLLSITDPTGQQTVFVYNSLGETISDTKPETGTTRYQYDENGLQVWEKDTLGQVTRLTYDSLGRILTKATFLSNGAPERTVEFQYDLTTSVNGIGRVCKVISPDMTYTYGYDNLGRQNSEQANITGLSETYITRYVYDPLGKLIQITYPDQSVVQYFGDESGAQLTRIMEGADTVAAFGNYDVYGEAGTTEFLNNVSTAHQYDIFGRVTSYQTRTGSYTHRSFTYDWSHGDKLMRIDDERTSPDELLTEVYGYDAAGRILTASGPYVNCVSGPCQYTYRYDHAGRRHAALLGQPDSLKYYYNPARQYQLDSITTSSTVNGISYDAKGNMRDAGTDNNSSTLPGSTAYHYSVSSQLLSVQNQNSSVNDTLQRYGYDGFGNRVYKIEVGGADKGNKSYYISSHYELLIQPDNKKVYTRYITGPQGVIQAKSKAGDNVRLLDRKSKKGYTFEPFVIPRDPFDLQRWIGKTLLLAGTAFLLWWLFRPLVIRLRSVYRHKNRRPVQSAPVVSSVHWWLMHRWTGRLCYGMMIWAFVIVGTTPAMAQSTGGSNGGYPEAGMTRYFNLDHLGSTILTTDTTGGISTKVIYAPYGSPEVQGHDDFRPKFTGKEWDEPTNLMYFGDRYYYPSGFDQFLTPDPAGQFHNPYQYSYGDPVGGTDPNGDFFVTLTILIVAGVIGAYLGASLANGSFNPAQWDWASGKTWAGIIGGAAIGVAVAAGAIAALAAAGVIGAGAATIGGVSASAIAFTAVDVAFLTYDAYQFAQHPNVENGIFLALDLIPFIGPLVGRAAHGVRGAAKGAEVAAHEGEIATKSGRAAGKTDEVAVRPGEFTQEVCALSFGKHTSVHTPNGVKEIQDVKVGDEIVSYDEVTGQRSIAAVSRVFTRIAAAVTLLVIGQDTIAATSQHPFLTPEGWEEVAALHAGDTLVSENNTFRILDEVIYRPGDVEVFNFEVEPNHTFFVSPWGVLVHNPKCKTITRKKFGTRERINATLSYKGSHTGTGTNKAARTYVNSKGVKIPRRYKAVFEYKVGGKTKYISSGWVKNSRVKGMKWDAGHIVGQQSGGSGRLRVNLFPQNPHINRGWSGTFNMWRRFEDSYNQALRKYGSGRFTMILDY